MIRPDQVLALLSDPRRLVQRLKLYSKRIRPHAEPWREDEAFVRLFERARERTLLSRERCFTLHEVARTALATPGNLAEIGVYRGGTAAMLATMAEREGRSIHLFDTFEGMPETDVDRDLHQAGDFADTSLEAVRAFVGECDHVHFHPGFFPATADALDGDEQFCFVHVDVDIAQSVTDSCTFFYPRMAVGGAFVFDDYGERSCPGATWAVDEFFRDKRERVQRAVTGQAIVVKLPGD